VKVGVFLRYLMGSIILASCLLAYIELKKVLDIVVSTGLYQDPVDVTRAMGGVVILAIVTIVGSIISGKHPGWAGGVLFIGGAFGNQYIIGPDMLQSTGIPQACKPLALAMLGVYVTSLFFFITMRSHNDPDRDDDGPTDQVEPELVSKTANHTLSNQWGSCGISRSWSQISANLIPIVHIAFYLGSACLAYYVYAAMQAGVGPSWDQADVLPQFIVGYVIMEAIHYGIYQLILHILEKGVKLGPKYKSTDRN
jgi:hypothetical protein